MLKHFILLLNLPVILLRRTEQEEDKIIEKKGS